MPAKVKDYTTRWGAKWVQRGKFASEHLMYEDLMPVLFLTRKDARAWIERKFGYIRTREDLRRAPHCWRLPVPVRVRFEMLP
jgi:hypothetical protein